MSCYSIYNTKINIDGHILRNSYATGIGSCGNLFSAGCFGYGFCSPYDFGGSFANGLGFGLGCATVNFLPQIAKGIGKGCSWLWNNAISPAFSYIGKGVSNLWNKIFKKNG